MLVFFIIALIIILSWINYLYYMGFLGGAPNIYRDLLIIDKSDFNKETKIKHWCNMYKNKIDKDWHNSLSFKITQKFQGKFTKDFDVNC